MYLVYDDLQLRRSSLGNSLLVKRRDWESAERDIASLTVDQLQEAAKAVSEGRLVENPTIQRLQRSILTIGMQVPESFAQKVKRRSEIKGLIARYGMPAFWLTINPSDLKNPLVLQLAGITYSAGCNRCDIAVIDSIYISSWNKLSARAANGCLRCGRHFIFILASRDPTTRPYLL